MLSLLGEQSVGSGTRRVEARNTVGELIRLHLEDSGQLVDERPLSRHVTESISVATDLKEAERKLGAARTRELLGQVDDIVAGTTPAGSFAVVATIMAGLS
jgi:alanyl-tRNA synthetase